MSAVCQPDTSCFILINFLRISVRCALFCSIRLDPVFCNLCIIFRAISRVYQPHGHRHFIILDIVFRLSRHTARLYKWITERITDLFNHRIRHSISVHRCCTADQCRPGHCKFLCCGTTFVITDYIKGAFIQVKCGILLLILAVEVIRYCFQISGFITPIFAIQIPILPIFCLCKSKCNTVFFTDGLPSLSQQRLRKCFRRHILRDSDHHTGDALLDRRRQIYAVLTQIFSGSLIVEHASH